MWGDREATSRCFSAVMNGPQDVTMLVLDAPPSPDNDPSAWFVSADALADAAQITGGRAVVVATMAECLNEQLRAHIIDRGLTPLLGLTEGLAALQAAAEVGQRCDSPHAPVTAPGATRLIDEAEAKARLRAIDVAVPDGIAATADDVPAAAARVGFPVTLKALGEAHKSESGAVRVGLDRRRRSRCCALGDAGGTALPGRGNGDRRGRRGAGRSSPRPTHRLAGDPRPRRCHHRGVERRDPPARASHPRTTFAAPCPSCAVIRC